jgi:hypothetical protein
VIKEANIFFMQTDTTSLGVGLGMLSLVMSFLSCMFFAQLIKFGGKDSFTNKVLAGVMFAFFFFIAWDEFALLKIVWYDRGSIAGVLAVLEENDLDDVNLCTDVFSQVSLNDSLKQKV